MNRQQHVGYYSYKYQSVYIRPQNSYTFRSLSGNIHWFIIMLVLTYLPSWSSLPTHLNWNLFACFILVISKREVYLMKRINRLVDCKWSDCSFTGHVLEFIPFLSVRELCWALLREAYQRKPQRRTLVVVTLRSALPWLYGSITSHLHGTIDPNWPPPSLPASRGDRDSMLYLVELLRCLRMFTFPD